MSENFQKHLLKCSYCECYYNQNLALSSSSKLRGLVVAISLYIPNVWKIAVTSLSDIVQKNLQLPRDRPPPFPSSPPSN